MTVHPASSPSQTVPGLPGVRRRRDPRLDFFRGIGMFIIFIAHLPWNTWALWIPARFGFSDATEIFVFCSGMASAIAFGSIFRQRGWWLGTVRIAHRIWQVYWAHIALFLIIAALVARATATGWFELDYVGELNLYPFYEETARNLPALLTLTYVPNYFDILPMYIVILCLVPVVMALARLGRGAVAAFVIGVWLAAGQGLLDLPAEPWSDRTWFFNPFSWQLVFFTGFAFMSGWLPAPPLNRWLLLASVAVLLVTVPFAYFGFLNASPQLRAVADLLSPLTDKTHYGVLRHVHFLALAYLAWAAAGSGGRRLDLDGLPGLFVRVVQKVGQQSLAVFLTSLVAAQVLFMLRDHLGRTGWNDLLVNLIGFATLIATAYLVGWVKSAPWARPPAPITASHAEPPARRAPPPDL